MDYKSHKLSELLIKATRKNVITWTKKEPISKMVKCSYLGQYFTTTFKNKKICIFQTLDYHIRIGILDCEEKILIWNTTRQPMVMDDLYRLIRDIHYGIDSEQLLDEIIALFKGGI